MHKLSLSIFHCMYQSQLRTSVADIQAHRIAYTVLIAKYHHWYLVNIIICSGQHYDMVKLSSPPLFLFLLLSSFCSQQVGQVELVSYLGFN